MAFHYSYLQSLNDISSLEWNSITGTDYPFLRHEFLYALESSNSADLKSGWQPQHLLIYTNDKLVALLPLYIKTHSYGEYVFDWSWADAYHKNGIPYYPKLLSAIPFTPASGPRLASVYSYDSNEFSEIMAVVQQALCEKTLLLNASSWHILFPQLHELQHWQYENLQLRQGCQYHWINNNFNSFDDFLGRFSSRKRKDVRKERQRIVDSGIRLERLTGTQITHQHWQDFYRFYQLTYLKRSGHKGYLTPQFFSSIHNTLRDQLLLVMAYEGNEAIAGALNFYSSDTLYGRYWGSIKDVDCLHFEACYYQGIEFCIEKKLGRFDPGAQGEHKIQRGFVPTLTYSYHWIKNSEFRNAIKIFLAEETKAIIEYQKSASALLPFRQDL